MKHKVLALVAIAAFFSSVGFGALIEHWRMDAKINGYKLEVSQAQQKANNAARDLEQARQKASDDQALAVAEALANVKPKIKIITKKVIEYVKNPNTGKCELNSDWVYAHDKAAGLPRDSPTTGTVDGEARIVTDREALVAVTNNYAICQDRLIKLKGWQSWYQKVIDEN